MTLRGKVHSKKFDLIEERKRHVTEFIHLQQSPAHKERKRSQLCKNLDTGVFICGPQPEVVAVMFFFLSGITKRFFFFLTPFTTSEYSEFLYF